MSLQQTIATQLVKQSLRASFKFTSTLPLPVSALRTGMELGASLFPVNQQVGVNRTVIGGVAAELVSSQPQAKQVILHCHGGAFFTGSAKTHRALASHLSVLSGADVYMLDYRLAPEHKFPAALEDVLAVLSWLPNQATQWQADMQKVAIAGDSAGANLATVACYLTQGQAIQPKLQCLIYPVVDTTQERESFSLFAEGYMLERQHMHFFINHYLNHADERQDVRVSPLLIADKSQQPPALVFTAGFDPLRDEGLAYAQALEQAGVNVNYHCFDDLIHGFLQLGKIPVAAQAIDIIAKKVADSWCRLS